MTTLLNALHPSFDALSACADLSDLDAARTRAGRHVARCPLCAATVAEIRALGDAAREVQLPGAPAHLAERIEAAARADAGKTPRETPAPEADTWKTAPALRPTTHVPAPMRRAARRAGVALLAAAAVLAALLMPTSQGARLQAGAKSGRWVFTPARPAPGATVSVRYLPAADERTPRTLTLIAGFARPRGDRSPRVYNGINGFQDSIATLVRGRDGTYTGRFVLPADFSAMVVRLADSTGQVRERIMSPAGPVSRTYEPITLLVGGDARGAPSVESLTSALDLWHGAASSGYDVSDTLIRYFPSEPIGYAAARAPSPRNMLEGLIAWFKRGERQYLKFDRRFMAQDTVSAEHAMVMIRFAQRIDEPGEQRKWTMRLVREHPDDPRALQAYGELLAGMLSRDGTSDSVRRALPLADSLWERNGHRGVSEEVTRSAYAVGEDDAARRWSLRAMQGGSLTWRGDQFIVAPSELQDAETRRVAVPLLRERLQRSCVTPAGKVSIWGGYMSWTESCVASRASAYQALSVVARVEGRLPEALALADSSLVLMQSTGRCWIGGSRQRRGEALLAMGRPATAARDLAWGATSGSWQAAAYRDSIAPLLRPAVDSAAWEAAITAATSELTACIRDANRRMKERRDRERAAAEGQRTGR